MTGYIPNPAVARRENERLRRVESGCGAVAVGWACLFPPLSSGGAIEVDRDDSPSVWCERASDGFRRVSQHFPIFCVCSKVPRHQAPLGIGLARPPPSCRDMHLPPGVIVIPFSRHAFVALSRGTLSSVCSEAAAVDRDFDPPSSTAAI